jgi:hypothetical protein
MGVPKLEQPRPAGAGMASSSCRRLQRAPDRQALAWLLLHAGASISCSTGNQAGRAPGRQLAADSWLVMFAQIAAI